MRVKYKIFGLLMTSLFMIQTAMASIVVETTRVIFLSSDQEKTIGVYNSDATPSLVQSWVSREDKKSNDFMMTPPLFRLEGKGKAQIRLVKMNQDLPKDRESLYWLNVKGVPPVDPNAANIVAFTINSRLKLIYRPVGLNVSKQVEDAHKELEFSLSGNRLLVKNPTPYYVMLKTLIAGTEDLKFPGYIEPMGQKVYLLSKAVSKKQVTYVAQKDDLSAYQQETKKLN